MSLWPHRLCWSPDLSLKLMVASIVPDEGSSDAVTLMTTVATVPISQALRAGQLLCLAPW